VLDVHSGAKRRPPNPWKGRPNPRKGKTYPAVILTAEEVDAMLRQCSPKTRAGKRDLALFGVLYRCGLRIGELLELELRDVDLDYGVLRIRDSKNGDPRTVGMDVSTTELVRAWMHRRDELGLGQARTVFCTLHGSKLWGQQVRGKMKQLAARAGIDKRAHPHGLRHTNAAELHLGGMPMKLLQLHLGHRNMGSTFHYLSRLTGGDAAAYVAKRTWQPPAIG